MTNECHVAKKKEKTEKKLKNAECIFVTVYWYGPTNCTEHTEQVSDDNTKKYWISKLPSQLFHKPETFLLNILKIKTKNTVGISLLDFKSYYAITINKRQCNCLLFMQL